MLGRPVIRSRADYEPVLALGLGYARAGGRHQSHPKATGATRKVTGILILINTSRLENKLHYLGLFLLSLLPFLSESPSMMMLTFPTKQVPA
jgi:hypothetical protein